MPTIEDAKDDDYYEELRYRNRSNSDRRPDHRGEDRHVEFVKNPAGKEDYIFRKPTGG